MNYEKNDISDLKKRLKDFALRIVRMASSLPKDRIADVFARQIVRSGTSVAANYRAACKARSKAEFIAKLGIVEEEADETVFWIELAADANLVKKEKIEMLLQEGKKICAIVTASRKTAKRKPMEK